MLSRGVYILVFLVFAQFALAQPNSIPNLALWLNADSGIVLNAGKVSEWNDQSGNNNDVIQTVAGSQPTYIPLDPSLNNHALIGFDGLDEYYPVDG